jgi:hypothetical protein
MRSEPPVRSKTRINVGGLVVWRNINGARQARLAGVPRRLDLAELDRRHAFSSHWRFLKDGPLVDS